MNFPKLTDQFKSSVYHFYGGQKRKERPNRRDISFTADTSLIEETEQDEVPGAKLVSKTVLGPLRKMDDSFLHSKGLNNTDRERDGNLDESITKYKTREAIFPGKNIIQPLKNEDQPKIINSHKINPIINSKGHKGLSSRSWGPALSTFDRFKNDHIDGHRNKIDDFKTFTCYIGKQNIRYDIEKNMYKTNSLADSVNTGRNTYCDIEEDLVLICGGVNQKSFSVASSAYIFQSSTETVEKLPDMLIPRYQHSIVYLDKKAYILGGQGEGNEVLKNCCVLHIEEKIWFRIPSMNFERKNLSSFKSYKTGCIYAIGGMDNAGCLMVTGEKFDPKKLTWTNFSINPNPDFNLKEVIILGNFVTGEGSKMVEQVLILSKEKSPSLESLSYKLFSFDPELEMLRKKMEFNFTTKEPVSFGVYKQGKIYLFKKSMNAIAEVYNLVKDEWETQEFVTK